MQGFNRANYLLQCLRETSLSNILLRAITTISNHFIDAVSFGLNILSLDCFALFFKVKEEAKTSTLLNRFIINTLKFEI